MQSTPSMMEPLIPANCGQLEDLARELLARSAVLAGMLHPVTQIGVRELVRLINSYYSNLIEGNSTHPADIERAMRKDYSREPAQRDLQLESLAHIEVQRAIEERILREPSTEPSSPEFLRWVHGEFYSRLPEPLRWIVNEKTGEKIEVKGGEPRGRDVVVGAHVPPEQEALGLFLERFQSFYRRERWHGVMPIVAAAAAHHRLAWIHPFLDGNGRVTRLYTDACLNCLPVPGYGIWNVSRGLARDRGGYLAALSGADQPRRGDLDGRGNLSDQRLADFCRFFLATSLDQVNYMSGLLQLNGLLERIHGYVQMRSVHLIPSPTERYTGMKIEASRMLQEVLLRGEVGRGELAAASGLKRAGRDILAQLLEEGILVSSMPKAPVRLAFPTHLAGYLFPDLYPRPTSTIAFSNFS
jgi:Fic family protein